MENNFKCLNCDNDFHESSYSIVFIEGEPAYKVKGSFIKCPECKSCSIAAIEKKGEYNVTFGTFKSMSQEDKKKMLKKRSHEHSEAKLKERKQYLDKHFTGSSKGLNMFDTTN